MFDCHEIVLLVSAIISAAAHVTRVNRRRSLDDLGDRSDNKEIYVDTVSPVNNKLITVLRFPFDVIQPLSALPPWGRIRYIHSQQLSMTTRTQDKHFPVVK